MFEVYANDTPTGLTYVGRRARRDAAAVVRALARSGGWYGPRTHYNVRRVY